MKALTWLAAIGLLLAAAWHYRNAPYVRELLAGYKQPAAPNAAGKDKRSPEGAGPSPGTAPGALRKCVSGPRVLYTDGPCPEGSKEQSVEKGTVTVVVGQRPPGAAAAADPAASPPGARDVPAPAGEQSIREKRMERTTGK